MYAHITRVEIKGEIAILKDAEMKNWSWLSFKNDGVNIEISKDIVLQLYQEMVDSGDRRIEVQKAKGQDFMWICNECGSAELSSNVSEDDLEYIACTNCGCNEFHKEDIIGE